MYDSGYASFGADYYTYSVNNTAEAASATRTVAANLVHIADFLMVFPGISSILFGMAVICGFGIVLASCPKKVANEEKKEEAEAATQEAQAE